MFVKSYLKKTLEQIRISSCSWYCWELKFVYFYTTQHYLNFSASHLMHSIRLISYNMISACQLHSDSFNGCTVLYWRFSPIWEMHYWNSKQARTLLIHFATTQKANFLVSDKRNEVFLMQNRNKNVNLSLIWQTASFFFMKTTSVWWNSILRPALTADSNLTFLLIHPQLS